MGVRYNPDEEFRPSEEIAASVRVMTTWINEQIEAGATDALVDALRSKGWTVTPPEGKR